MPHFFVPPSNISGNSFVITGSDVHYLSRVRRVQAGDVIELFDGTGTTYRARVDSIGRGEIRGTVIATGSAMPAAVRLAVYLAVPKGDRFDWFVEKAAELGVAEVIPLVAERSTVREFSPAKIERWQRLATAACQQCRRPELMQVAAPLSLDDALKGLPKTSFNVIPWEGEPARTMKDAFTAAASAPREANIIIGPEGGFAAREIEAAERAGVVPVSMGKRILRIETAGLLASILLLNLAGEYGNPTP